MDIKWGSHHEKNIEIDADAVAEDVIDILAKNWSINPELADQCCIKTIGTLENYCFVKYSHL